ncbi:hypothetical protein UACE39S_00330 [Ureibacillus acetophenoni]
MRKGFKILPTNPYGDKDKTIKSYYSSWREFNKGNSESKETFAMLYTSFFNDKYLAKLDGGAIKLYLFFCFNANNTNGDSWYSIPKIAEYFDVQTRTVDKWIKTLVDHQLIHREQNNKKSFTTYLLPYSTTLMKAETEGTYPDDSQDIIEDIVGSIKKQKDIFGEIIGIYHLFQWKKSRRRLSNTNTQWILFITKRTNGILTGHYYELTSSEHMVISKRDFEQTCFFNSRYKYKNDYLLGIALNNEVDIQSNNYEVSKGIIEQLAIINRNELHSSYFVEYKQSESEDEEVTLEE